MAAAMARGKVAITGSSGILGQRLYTALRADGWEVVGLGLAEGVSQGGPGRDGASETRNEFVDVACNLSMACPDLSGFTHVVHLAGVGSPDASFEQVLRGNVVATQHVLEAAARRADAGPGLRECDAARLRRGPALALVRRVRKPPGDLSWFSSLLGAGLVTAPRRRREGLERERESRLFS